MNESTKNTLQDLLYKLPSEGQIEEIRDEIADVIKDGAALSDDEFESLERLVDALENAASSMARAMIAFDEVLA
ncbi:hypothetical protein AB3G45_22430 [Shinella sp. S4-D37]|uniref:hypothetical protein n=1 Tax=Shinella sp. S4-D37 TaxID=3161999 RepID=UPI003466EBDF